MSKLTAQQAQSLWDNRTEDNKYYIDSDNKNSDNFECYRFCSKLDGYYYNLKFCSPEVNHDSTESDIETIVKNELQNIMYLGVLNFS